MKITMLPDGNVMFEDVKIIHRNFAGNEDMYNAKGNRNFCIIVEDENDAEMMRRDGWLVKEAKPREDGGERAPYAPVSIRFDVFPPTVFLITGADSNEPRRTRITEEEVEILDWVDIRTADLIIRPYRWTLKDGRNGIKAMVKSLFITINEDALETKYRDLEEMPARAGRVEE